MSGISYGGYLTALGSLEVKKRVLGLFLISPAIESHDPDNYHPEEWRQIFEPQRFWTAKEIRQAQAQEAKGIGHTLSLIHI